MSLLEDSATKSKKHLASSKSNSELIFKSMEDSVKQMEEDKNQIQGWLSKVAKLTQSVIILKYLRDQKKRKKMMINFH